MKSHVDKEAFFERELPAALQQEQIPAGLALHLLLPELALLLMSSSTSIYHSSILKSIMSIVAPLSSSIVRSDGGTAMPLRLFSEVMEHAFDSSDRAIRCVSAYAYLAASPRQNRGPSAS